ncbi:MAG: 8-oxoguanine deaminase [Geminicoccaceae bacterium]
MSRSLLLADAELVATMDEGLGEIPGGSVLVEDGRILAVGRDLAAEGAERIDLAGCVLLPGLVNTHHHFYQTLTRAVPAAQDADLFRWLETLYPIWARLTPEMIRVSTTTAMLELLLSGCTTTSDHLYVFPDGVTLDDSLEAAAALGMRFHATRGAMSVGRSRGGLPPDELVEGEEAILADMARVVDRWHDPADGALLRVALAPCSPFSVSRELMRDTAALARDRQVMLHTHLAENASDVAYSREKFGCTPAEYAAELGWLGPDVWHAHCVQLDAPGIAAFARTRTGVAHCPCSNMRLASGIAPVRAMLDAGVSVGLGVDGSASNDAGHLLAEARQALLLARVAGDPAGLSARAVLRLATAGGAAVLGRHDIGSLVPGKEADLAAFRIDGIAQAGALHDPLAALVFGQPGNAWYTIVKGRALVAEGRPTGVDLAAHVRHHNALARSLLG